MGTTAIKKDDKIILKDVRLAFPDLFEAKGFVDPKTGKQGEPQFAATFLLDRSDPETRATIMAEEERIAKEKWGAKAPAILAEIRENNRGAIKRGELKASYDGFPGNDFIAANNKVRPTVVNRNGAPVAMSDGVVYAGCYGIGHVVLWAQDNAWGKRINANVTGFQFMRDGDSFGGGPPPSSTDEFEDLGEGGGDASSLMDD
jgi:hypothetical protein